MLQVKDVTFIRYVTNIFGTRGFAVTVSHGPEDDVALAWKLAKERVEIAIARDCPSPLPTPPPPAEPQPLPCAKCRAEPETLQYSEGYYCTCKNLGCRICGAIAPTAVGAVESWNWLMAGRDKNLDAMPH
jgi:hypothetical protein